jgi:hypothetical protein
VGKNSICAEGILWEKIQRILIALKKRGKQENNDLGKNITFLNQVEMS